MAMSPWLLGGLALGGLWFATRKSSSGAKNVYTYKGWTVELKPRPDGLVDWYVEESWRSHPDYPDVHRSSGGQRLPSIEAARQMAEDAVDTLAEETPIWYGADSPTAP